MVDAAAGAPATGKRRRPDKAVDLRWQPGFNQIAWLCLFVLYAPILMLVLFSFNDNRSVTTWTHFSFRWYIEAFGNEGIQNAAVVSLQVALFSTVFATAFATMAALATTRTENFRGLTAAYTLINQPLMVPEIVTAVATLSFFALVKQLTGVTGIGYLMLAHTTFCIPFAYMPIRARLEDMDLTLERAAEDLYARPFQVFRCVTLPLLLPGIVAGAMLAFVVSLDDVIITLLVAGPGETTLPIYILGQIRRGITPEINAVSSIFLLISVLFVTLFFALGKKRN
jgi:spermidine/putrescine transport system permease protein